VTQVTESSNGAGINTSGAFTSSATTRVYCYDAQDRLMYRNSAAAGGSVPACGSSSNDEAYTYDAPGNRTAAPSATFSYDSAGKLSGCSPSCGTIAHDDAGRMTRWNSWYLAYDSAGRLASACKSSSCASTADKVVFTYDGEGRRTSIAATPAGLGTDTTTFTYEGDAVVRELTNTVLTKTYTLDEQGSIVTVTIPSGQTGAGTYLVTWNAHGDALALHQINQGSGTLTIANSYSYDTWGKPSTTQHGSYADLGFRFLYVGRYGVAWDNQLNLDLLYMHARHYAPALGRFLQPDPSRAEVNGYAYVENSPVTKVDPSGLYLTEMIQGGGGGGGDGKGWDQLRAWGEEAAWWMIPYGRLLKWIKFVPTIRHTLDFAGNVGKVQARLAIVAADGTRISGITSHGVDRIIGDLGKRAGVSPQALLDALKRPLQITKTVWDDQGRPSKVYFGSRARVVVNPQSGRIISVNPLSRWHVPGSGQ
jgi:RHS repeat-associated protein